MRLRVELCGFTVRLVHFAHVWWVREAGYAWRTGKVLLAAPMVKREATEANQEIFLAKNQGVVWPKRSAQAARPGGSVDE